MTSQRSRSAAQGLADPTHSSAVDAQDKALMTVLPAGMTFPYDFGFVPSARGGDGDPLDVLVKGPDAARRCIKQARKRAH